MPSPRTLRKIPWREISPRRVRYDEGEAAGYVRECLKRLEKAVFYAQDVMDGTITGVFDHTSLLNLGADDHTQYLRLAGRGTAAQVLTHLVNTTGVLRVNAITGTTANILTVERNATVLARFNEVTPTSISLGLKAGTLAGRELFVSTSSSGFGQLRYEHGSISTSSAIEMGSSYVDLYLDNARHGSLVKGTTWADSVTTTFLELGAPATHQAVLVTGEGGGTKMTRLGFFSSGTIFSNAATIGAVPAPTGLVHITAATDIVPLLVATGGTTSNAIEVRLQAAATKNFIECFTSAPETAFWVGPTGHTEILLRSNVEGLIIKGVAGQTADLLRLVDSAVNPLVFFGPGGAVAIRPTTASAVALTVRRTSGATADIQRWDSSTGATTFTKVTAGGNVNVRFDLGNTLTGQLTTPFGTTGTAALSTIQSNTTGWSGNSAANGLWRLEPTLSDPSSAGLPGVGATTMFRINATVSDSAGAQIGLESNVDVSDNSAIGGNAAAQSLAFNASSSGSANITGLIGASGITLHQSTGTCAAQVGYQCITRSQTGAGKTTDMKAVVGDCLSNAAIGTYTAFYAGQPTMGGGAICDLAYGVYIEAIPLSGITTGWSIYSEGGSSYHPGNIQQSYTPGSFSVATGFFSNMVKNLTMTSTQRAKLAGTSRLRIH